MAVRKRKWTTRKGEIKEAWIVQYLDADGIDRIRTFDRKKDADAYQDTVRIDVRKGLHTPPSKSATVAEAAEAWFDQVKANGMNGRGPAERATLRQYRQHIDLHIVPKIGRVKLSSLTSKSVERFQKELLAGLSRALAKKVFTSFKSLLKVAKYGHVADGLAIGSEKRKRKLEAGRDFPTTDEVKRLIAAADGKRRALLMVAALAGLRASELRGLRWKDVDFKAAELHVRQRADRWNRIGAPKSDSSSRTVPLDQATIAELKAWKLACPKGEAGVVFPNATGGIEHHKNALRSLAPVMTAAGVVDKDRPKYGLHAFRHFFASWCINPKSRGGRELPAKVVQELLGHNSIAITLDLYGHLFPRGDDRAELDAASRALLA